MYSIWHEMFKIALASGAAPPDPAEGAYDAPPDLLVVRGFLLTAIATSRLRRLQFSQLGPPMIKKIQPPTFWGDKSYTGPTSCRHTVYLKLILKGKDEDKDHS